MEKKYIVYIYAGVGVTTFSYEVEAYHEEQALEMAVAHFQAAGYGKMFLDFEDYDELEDYEKDDYIYIDPTMEDPDAHPTYIGCDCFAIKEVA